MYCRHQYMGAEGIKWTKWYKVSHKPLDPYYTKYKVEYREILPEEENTGLNKS